MPMLPIWKTKGQRGLATGALALGGVATLVLVAKHYLDDRQAKRLTKIWRKRFTYYIYQQYPSVWSLKFGQFHHASIWGNLHMRARINKRLDVVFTIRNFESNHFMVRIPKLLLSDNKQTFELTSSLYQYLSDMVYYVDRKVTRPDHMAQVKVGECLVLGHQTGEIVLVADDAKTGFQAMAIKTSDHLVLAYAGTNPKDINDLVTDFSAIARADQANNQLQNAEAFYQACKQAYPDAVMSCTGHSLGGFLALQVALGHGLSGCVFNAPEPDLDLTQSQDLVNYRNVYDRIGNYGGDRLGITRYYETGFNPNFLGYHGLATWDFEINGQIKGKQLNDKLT